jgi:AcrR family transcriptional regulator
VRELRSSSCGPEGSSRERIYAAMVTTVAERGYGATGLTDVIQLAGVSRSTFDEHFAGRQDCFIKTIEAILAFAEAEIAVELEQEERWDAQLRRIFTALVDLIVAQPAAARMCLVEAYVAGPDAVACVDRVARAAGRHAVAVLERSPERAGMPPDLARVVLGGLRKVIQTRLYTGREQELPQMASELMDWALSYRTPPVALRRPRPPVPVAPHAAPRDGSDPHRPIIDAVTEVVTERGYRHATIAEIAGRASITLSTFHQCFDDKQSAYLAALDDAAKQVFDVALSGYRQAENWPHGVHHGLTAVLSHLSREPTTARFSAEAVWGGPEVMRRFDLATMGFRAMLAEGLKTRSKAPGLLAEAIGSSLVALVYTGTVNGDPERLYELTPTAVFIALAPSVGSIEACAVINGD